MYSDEMNCPTLVKRGSVSTRKPAPGSVRILNRPFDGKAIGEVSSAAAPAPPVADAPVPGSDVVTSAEAGAPFAPSATLRAAGPETVIAAVPSRVAGSAPMGTTASEVVSTGIQPLAQLPRLPGLAPWMSPHSEWVTVSVDVRDSV